MHQITKITTNGPSLAPGGRAKHPRPFGAVSNRQRPRTRASVQAVAAAQAVATPFARESTAVILGSGMSGLCTAKVLSKHFDRVTIIDRDDIPASWPQQPSTAAAKQRGARRGVTQYNHLHVLAARGLLALDTLFEGRFVPGLQSAGAVLSDVVTGFNSYHPAGGSIPWQAPEVPSKGPVLICQATRHLVEGVTCGLLQDAPGVQLMYNTTVTGLVLEQQQQQQPEQGLTTPGESKQRVTGVMLRGGSSLQADLVVDCSGRQSKMPQWLEAAGLPAPRVSQVNASLGYASWLVKLDPEVAARTLQGKTGVYAIAAYPKTVGAAVVAVEDGLHMAALCTYAQDTPPFDDAQLSSFAAKQTWNPIVSEVLVGARPVSPVSRFYRVSSTWRHYDELQLPDGLLVTSDSVCSFNPVYGHGMTVAALQAEKLDELLNAAAASSEQLNSAATAATAAAAAAGGTRKRPAGWLDGFPQQHQQAIKPIIQRVWDLSVGGDLRFDSTTSTDPPAPGSGLMNAYFDTLMVLAAKDPEVTEALLRVMHLIDETAELTSPRMLGKVVRHLLTAPFAGLLQRPQGMGTGAAGGGNSGNSGGATSGATTVAAGEANT